MRKVLLFAAVMIGVMLHSISFGYSGGDGTADHPYEIANIADYQQLSSTSADWNKFFIMTKDIDLVGITAEPIGNGESPFSGYFNGNHHTILNLTIFAPNQTHVGFFGYIVHSGQDLPISQICNLGLVDVKITGCNNVGGLVGTNGEWAGSCGTSIESCYTTGSVSGTGGNIGGLAGNISSFGYNSMIINCYSTCSVSGSYNVGGLAGNNDAFGAGLSGCHASGLVSGTSFVGGLVGINVCPISDCYSTGLVNGADNVVGGLVGHHESGEINSCYATGSVCGKDVVGGLAGYTAFASIVSCHAEGSVIGNAMVGGLIGLYETGQLTSCYATGSVAGTGHAVGGLAGYNGYGAVISCYAKGSVAGIGNSVGGLIGSNYDGSLTFCYATGSVKGNNDVGGLAGNAGGSIASCYASGPVIGSLGAGGLVGNSGAIITTCYAGGSVSGSTYVGGLAGLNSGSIADCYARGYITPNGSLLGGLIGYNMSGTLTNCFWDMDTTGRLTGGVSGTSSGFTGKSISEMMTQSTFTSANWDFSTADGDPADWQMPNYDYPRLAWETSFHRYSFGTGDPGDPYQIVTTADLLAMGAHINDYDKRFILSADIDLSNKSFYRALIAPDTSSDTGFQGCQFTGIFDGNNHVISNLTFAAGSNYVGLFGYVGSGGQIKNLRLTDINIQRGNQYIGGLIGWSEYGTITNCCTTGIISGNYNVGGLIGTDNQSTILFCYSTSRISGIYSVGGLIGSNMDGVLASCYATGSVTGTGLLGGLVGYNYNSGNGTITSCYSTGSVSGASNIGGLLGYRIGGIVNHSFWDMETSQQSTSAGGTGKTTLEMKTLLTFTSAGWDFTDTDGDPADWRIPVDDYPRLVWDYCYGGGDGTASDPYQIQSSRQMNAIGANPADWAKCFKLMADIDMSMYTGAQYNIIGNSSSPFTGTFDGNGYVIRNLNYTADALINNVGVFGYTKNAVIRNLKIENISILSNGWNIGGLAGTSEYSTLTGCEVTGVISCNGIGVGGLVGTNEHSTLTACHAGGSISGMYGVGGMVGVNLHGALTACCADDSVVGMNLIGGLAGLNSGSSSAIHSCYSAGTVQGVFNVGGLVGGNYSDSVSHNSGSGIITDCYSSGSVSGASNTGGLIGYNYLFEITSCFWDEQCSGQSISSGGTGKTTQQMQTLSTFTSAGWDFVNETANGIEDIWQMPAGDYPRLYWEFLVPSSKAKSPNPANGAIGQPINTDITWANGIDTISSDVYWGTRPNLDSSNYKGNQTDISYDPGILAYDTTYYWRIDAVTSEGIVTGDVWRFSTESNPAPLPLKTINSNPSNGAINQSIHSILSWSDGGGADSYDVYFGLDSTFDYVDNQTETSYDPGTLAYNTTYYWRIDAVNSEGTTTGDVWQFTTGSISGQLAVQKFTAAAGKTRGLDSIQFSGLLDAAEADIPAAGNILVEISADDMPVTQSLTFSVNGTTFKKGKYAGKDLNKNTFTLDTKTGKMAFSAKNLDLTGLGCPIMVAITIGDYAAQMELDEAIVNGKKSCPIQLMAGVKNTLTADKYRIRFGKKANTDSFTIQGTFTLEEDYNKSNPLVITLGTQTFTVDGGQFNEKKNVVSCKKVTLGDGAVVDARFDFVKCSYTISVKNTTINQSGTVDFGIDCFGIELPQYDIHLP